MIYESENVEYKAKYVDELYKEVMAFANTNGGMIYVGVDDNGNRTGVADVDETYNKITNSIRDAIAPDVTMFVKYGLVGNVIEIEISEGTAKPYYIKSKGLKPSGVYIRQGASSVPASPEQIRQMIKQSDGDIYEAMRSLEQSLTFEAASKVFAAHKISFSDDKFISLGICRLNDHLYTNLGKIVSDQCEHTIKTAIFSDDANTVFKAHREFTGSVFLQLDEAFSYLMLCNNNKSEFSGVTRIDKWDYPEEAIREALLNAIVHRDYSFSGSIIINVNDNAMEFISLGGLLQGLSTDDIRNGISQPRNRNLAEIFHRLNYIESYGTGIRRIFALYSECERKPQIDVTSNSFRIILPNMNKVAVTSVSPKENITPQRKTVLDYLTKNNEMTEEDVKNLLDIKKTRAYTLIKQMENEGLISIKGRGASKKIFIRE